MRFVSFLLYNFLYLSTLFFRLVAAHDYYAYGTSSTPSYVAWLKRKHSQTYKLAEHLETGCGAVPGDFVPDESEIGETLWEKSETDGVLKASAGLARVLGALYDKALENCSLPIIKSLFEDDVDIDKKDTMQALLAIGVLLAALIGICFMGYCRYTSNKQRGVNRLSNNRASRMSRRRPRNYGPVSSTESEDDALEMQPL